MSATAAKSGKHKLEQTSEGKAITQWKTCDCRHLYRANTENKKTLYYFDCAAKKSLSPTLRKNGILIKAYLEFKTYHLGILLLELGSPDIFKDLDYNLKRNEVYTSYKLQADYFKKKRLSLVHALKLLELKFLEEE